MQKTVYSNLHTFGEIAGDAYEQMRAIQDIQQKPRSDGSEGLILTYDPSRQSFKQAVIAIAFFGIWIESLLHILIVDRFDEKTFLKYDFKSYRAKLELLGFADVPLLDSIDKFQIARKHLMHEKAHLDSGRLMFAQIEAQRAHEIFRAIEAELEKSHG